MGGGRRESRPGRGGSAGAADESIGFCSPVGAESVGASPPSTVCFFALRRAFFFADLLIWATAPPCFSSNPIVSAIRPFRERTFPSRLRQYAFLLLFEERITSFLPPCDSRVGTVFDQTLAFAPSFLGDGGLISPSESFGASEGGLVRCQFGVLNPNREPVTRAALSTKPFKANKRFFWSSLCDRRFVSISLITLDWGT
jgi:hypothetical protein